MTSRECMSNQVNRQFFYFLHSCAQYLSGTCPAQNSLVRAFCVKAFKEPSCCRSIIRRPFEVSIITSVRNLKNIFRRLHTSECIFGNFFKICRQPRLCIRVLIFDNKKRITYRRMFCIRSTGARITKCFKNLPLSIGEIFSFSLAVFTALWP